MKNKLSRVYKFLIRKTKLLSLFFSKKISLGNENPDLTFYLIRRHNNISGVFSNHNVFLKHIYFAFKNNYIPVIDMQYEESCLYHEKDQVGDVNAWELFFEQPTKFKLKDVLISKNIILSTNKVEGAFDLNIQYLLKNKNNLNSWIEITDKFLRYNKKTSNYLESNYKNYIPKNKKVLGVSVRAGYIKGKYKGHPVQPGIEELIDRVKRCFTKYNYDLVFLSVEDYEVVHKFKEEFNEKLLVVKRPRLNDVNFNISKNSDFNNKLYKKESKNTVEESSLENLNNFMDTISFERKNDKYLKGLEYMSEMYILSKLDGLICGETSGTVATVLRNKNGFDNLYFYNLGVY